MERHGRARNRHSTGTQPARTGMDLVPAAGPLG